MMDPFVTPQRNGRKRETITTGKTNAAFYLSAKSVLFAIIMQSTALARLGQDTAMPKEDKPGHGKVRAEKYFSSAKICERRACEKGQ
jgi:hypothetical protein